MAGKIIAAVILVVLASAGVASARIHARHHQGWGMSGHGSPYGRDFTPGYSSTARHKPTDTNGF